MKICQIMVALLLAALVFSVAGNAEVKVRDSSLKQMGDDPWVNIRSVNELGLTVKTTNDLRFMPALNNYLHTSNLHIPLFPQRSGSLMALTSSR